MSYVYTCDGECGRSVSGEDHFSWLKVSVQVTVIWTGPELPSPIEEDEDSIESKELHFCSRECLEKSLLETVKGMTSEMDLDLTE